MKKFFAVFGLLVMTAAWGVPAVHADDDILLERLKSIEEKQDRMMQDLEALKSELQIVKIRVSSR